MSSDIAKVISSIGVAGEALGIGDATPIDRKAKQKPAAPKDPCIDENTGAGGREVAAATAAINSSVVSEDQEQDTEEMSPCSVIYGREGDERYAHGSAPRGREAIPSPDLCLESNDISFRYFRHGD